MPTLTLFNFGAEGVNVDASDLHMKDGELRKAQNAISDPLGNQGGLKNRPGLTRFNALAANGSILGGISVPLPDTRSAPGEGVELHLYIGAEV
jgi:hypothetical protein